MKKEITCRYSAKISNSFFSGILILFFACIILSVYYETYGVILAGISLLFSILFSFLHFLSKNFTASFLLEEDKVTIKTPFRRREVNFSDISEIFRESYEQDVSFFGISGTTSSPNQYCIFLKNGKSIIFRVAISEEKAYQRKLNKLVRNIYHTKLFMRTKTIKQALEEDEMTENMRDYQFEKERPKADYSLVLALLELSQYSGIEITDTVEDDGINS
ncbi:hypothetical protein [Fusobacterium necrophorum]|uniref:Lipoprotein n=1 Tax=Fusobacterium necrophorum DJ-2 TaxID=1441737 RepID=A0AB73C1J7_9FUSO|nr:hypothetical protein [Fusobacterium necrophorum]KDE64823.1 hypothetical protein FUSO4_07335 [Fusobacterium necrophorum DJ-1]KDE70848.1 hypothetical protein FUSO8_08695 [Fusobacterium necrophorum DJ-2]MCF0161864.1 hypothetical protein [Fusobacterium necrophorum]